LRARARNERHLIYDVVPVYIETMKSGKYIVFIARFYLVYWQYQKSNLPGRRIEGPTRERERESLSFAFIKLREMSIGRALLTRRIL